MGLQVSLDEWLALTSALAPQLAHTGASAAEVRGKAEVAVNTLLQRKIRCGTLLIIQAVLELLVYGHNLWVQHAG